MNKLAAALVVALAAEPALARPRNPQQSPPPEPMTAAYDVLDNVGGEWVNLATFPVRPMVYDPDSGKLWAVNHHDSTVERFSGLTQTPDKVYGVPWSPVAIAWWDGDGGENDDELLVVCRGTWAVVGLDPDSGKPTRLLQLRPGDTLPGGIDTRIGRMAEPGDILVDEANDRAFVSCTGADSVVQIDLVDNEIVRVFNQQADPAFRIKSPLFLSWDSNGTDVLCAPLHSGNNSSAAPGLTTSTLVEDLSPTQAGDQGLPDEDLFRIEPFVDATNPGSVEVVFRDLGAIQFAHKLHPNGRFWQLNTEADNKDPNKQTEPSVKGIFASNRISMVQDTVGAWSNKTTIGLDPGDLGGAITTANTVGQPFALEFNAAGNAFIAGLLTDNVLVLNSTGGYLMEWNLPDGAIPRGLLRHPTVANLMVVYCWGDNRVRVYQVDTTAGTASLRVAYELQHDPTPDNLAAGRKEFFDASHSAEQNLACASCHVEGGNDFLMWNLSAGAMEEKGPMFTQTLVGLERLAPFHWRGERQLADFRPAFRGLLGAAPLGSNGTSEPGEEPDDTEFARFQEFLFSLRNPANPNQNRERLLDATIHHHDTTMDGPGEDPPNHESNDSGSAIAGQAGFQLPDHVAVGRHACVDCHDLPTGTINDINVEQERGVRPRRGSMKPAPFHEGWRKHQSLVEVIRGGVSSFPPFLGSGFSHTGERADLFRFVSIVTDTSPEDDELYEAEVQKANDLTDFLHVFDQGLAPAVHYGFLLDEDTSAGLVASELEGYLHGEMEKGNCDIAVVGVVDSSGTLERKRWTWDRVASAYVCEDPAFSNRSLSQFSSGATQDGESNLFLGLPRGMAERFAIDYDMDGLRNHDPTESNPYNPAQPGWNNGVTPDYLPNQGPDILWWTTKVARIVFTTNEPTTAVIDYDEPDTAAMQVTSPRLSRHHSILLTGLRPSTSHFDGFHVPEYGSEDVTYYVTITLVDATGNQVVNTPFPVTTAPFIVPAELDLGIGGPMDAYGSEKRNQRSHVVQAICLGGTECDDVTKPNANWHVEVDLTLALKRGAWVASQPVPAADRAVIGRVLIERASGEVETASAAGLQVIPVNGTAHLVDTVQYITPSNFDGELEGLPEPAGKLLAGIVPSTSSGLAQLDFEVNPTSSLGSTENLVAGDRIVFNVEAIVELDPAADPKFQLNAGSTEITYRTLWLGTFMQWSFPDTKEARSSIRTKPLF